MQMDVKSSQTSTRFTVILLLGSNTSNSSFVLKYNIKNREKCNADFLK